MDFLARLNQGLVEPPRPKSKLAPYFEAHMLFQGTYHTPSPTPSPPCSPRLTPSALAVSNESQQPILSPPLRSLKRKRANDGDGDGMDALPKQMRTLRTAYRCAMQPLTPEATATPPSSACSKSSPLPRTFTAIKKRKKDLSRTSVARTSGNHAMQRRTSVMVGKYHLRRTAARTRRESGQGSVT
jgi:hypothetical protein